MQISSAKPLFLSALALACAPVTLSAQSTGAGSPIHGTVELEYSDDGTNDMALLYGDADASFSFTGGGQGMGFDAGVTAYLGEGGSSDTAIFGALTYTTSYGKFSFGLPRNASSGLSRMPVIGGTQAVGAFQKAWLGDLPLTNYLANDDYFAGVRYDGHYGAVKTALSFHHTKTDVNFADLAVKYDSGFFFTNGSLQYFNGNGGTEATVFHGEAGAATDFYDAGIGVTSGDKLIPDAWQAWASFRPVEQLGISATMLDPDGAAAIWGLSAKYGFMQGGYVQGGVSDTKNADALWDVSVGFSF